jgi:hypothetical protein
MGQVSYFEYRIVPWRMGRIEKRQKTICAKLQVTMKVQILAVAYGVPDVVHSLYFELGSCPMWSADQEAL